MRANCYRWMLGLLLGLACMVPFSAAAWGNAGHRIVGEVAWHYLTPLAAEEVRLLLAGEDAYDTLAESATWADSFARRHERYRWLDPLHYVNVPSDSSGYRPSHCPLPKSCIVRAIDRFRHDLIHAASRDKRVLALRMLAHLCGDIHQPLHVSHPDQRGGTRTEVEFLGKRQNLHSIWDTGIVETAIERSYPDRDDSFLERWGAAFMAYELRMEITPDEVQRWGEVADASAWADESFEVARAYAWSADGEVLGEATYREYSAVVRGRLKQAGVRLASLLNRAFAEEPSDSDPSMTLEDRPLFAEACAHPLCEPPAGYYASVEQLQGKAMLIGLGPLLEANHRRLSYGQVWEALADVDEDPERPGNVLLFYSGRSQAVGFRAGRSDARNAWNREHLFPNSHGFKSESSYAYTDVHHLMPTDVSINSTRGNKDFAAGGQPLAQAPDNFSDSDSFEPRDAVKGNVARAVFYMAVRYDGRGNDGGTPDLQVVTGRTSTGEPRIGDLCTLLVWHRQDSPDTRERLRNAKIHASWQGNRNPFVDHPEWADSIWGADCPAQP